MNCSGCDLLLKDGDTVTSGTGTSYTITGLLGEGAYGKVYSAMTESSTRVAIKVIKNGGRYQDVGYHEAQILFHVSFAF